jgi:hypothetical protein
LKHGRELTVAKLAGRMFALAMSDKPAAAHPASVLTAPPATA